MNNKTMHEDISHAHINMDKRGWSKERYKAEAIKILKEIRESDDSAGVYTAYIKDYTEKAGVSLEDIGTNMEELDTIELKELRNRNYHRNIR